MVLRRALKVIHSIRNGKNEENRVIKGNVTSMYNGLILGIDFQI